MDNASARFAEIGCTGLKIQPSILAIRVRKAFYASLWLSINAPCVPFNKCRTVRDSKPALDEGNGAAARSASVGTLPPS